MHSRPEVRFGVLLAMLLAAWPALALERAPLSAAEIDAAVLQLRSDPNLGLETKSKTLHWVNESKPETPKPVKPQTWLLSLFDFLGQTASLFLWIFGFFAAGFLGVWLYRVIGARAPRVTALARPDRASVGELDIRPASLPADIGAAARALLDAGQTRAALALLYRGALSRAVHRHGIDIGESATEGEVLRAVDGRLDANGVGYFRMLVQLWQNAVYAGTPTAAEAVLPLCARFTEALG